VVGAGGRGKKGFGDFWPTIPAIVKVRPPAIFPHRLGGLRRGAALVLFR